MGHVGDGASIVPENSVLTVLPANGDETYIMLYLRNPLNFGAYTITLVSAKGNSFTSITCYINSN